MPTINSFNPDNRSSLTNITQGPTVSVIQWAGGSARSIGLTTENRFTFFTIPANNFVSDDVITISSFFFKGLTQGTTETLALRYYWSTTTTVSAASIKIAEYITGTYGGVYNFNKRFYIGNGAGSNNQAVGLTSSSSAASINDLFQRTDDNPIIYPLTFSATSYILIAASGSSGGADITYYGTKIQKE
jgi:hypothetical protein